MKHPDLPLETLVSNSLKQSFFNGFLVGVGAGLLIAAIGAALIVTSP